MTPNISSVPATAEAAPPVAQRKRRSGPRFTLPPNVSVRFSHDGLTVFVPLQGSSGLGMTATLSASAWLSDIVPTFGSVWLINWNGARTGFQVCRAHRDVALAADQRGDRPKANLARLISGAARGQCVWYVDRNPLNLRSSNLELITRAELLARIRRTPDGA